MLDREVHRPPQRLVDLFPRPARADARTPRRSRGPSSQPSSGPARRTMEVVTDCLPVARGAATLDAGCATRSWQGPLGDLWRRHVRRTLVVR